ncbi:hypothetical protein A5643_15085 [Mycobacterium sp. 1274756.6]|nr:hypothetical protein A5643_15085 [Mycobacterium sp. 1274756.6]
MGEKENTTPVESVAPREDADEATTLPRNAASQSGGVRRTPELGDDADEVGDTSRLTDAQKPEQGASQARTSRRIRFAAGVALSTLLLMFAAAAGFFAWYNAGLDTADRAGAEALAAAKDSTVALLSYQPDTVETDLGDARGRLTGDFQESYTQLIEDVVIPGAQQRHIAATAMIPAGATVSASRGHVVVLLFVNQTVVVGDGVPTDTMSSVRVTLDKIDGRWLIAAFEPV